MPLFSCQRVCYLGLLSVWNEKYSSVASVGFFREIRKTKVRAMENKQRKHIIRGCKLKLGEVDFIKEGCVCGLR